MSMNRAGFIFGEDFTIAPSNVEVPLQIVASLDLSTPKGDMSEDY